MFSYERTGFDPTRPLNGKDERRVDYAFLPECMELIMYRYETVNDFTFRGRRRFFVPRLIDRTSEYLNDFL